MTRQCTRTLTATFDLEGDSLDQVTRHALRQRLWELGMRATMSSHYSSTDGPSDNLLEPIEEVSSTWSIVVNDMTLPLGTYLVSCDARAVNEALNEAFGEDMSREERFPQVVTRKEGKPIDLANSNNVWVEWETLDSVNYCGGYSCNIEGADISIVSIDLVNPSMVISVWGETKTICSSLAVKKATRWLFEQFHLAVNEFTDAEPIYDCQVVLNASREFQCDSSFLTGDLNDNPDAGDEEE